MRGFALSILCATTIVLAKEVETYIPFGLELLEAAKGLGDRLVGEDRLVLLERPLADLGVVGLGDGVLEKGLFELVERDDDAEELGEGFLEVALGACLG